MGETRAGQVLEATLERITYANPQTGYTVARVDTGRGADRARASFDSVRALRFGAEGAVRDTLLPFVQAGKPVFGLEYGGQSKASSVCARANALGFDTLVKNLSLDAARIQELAHQHEALVDRISAHDSAGAAQMMERHLLSIAHGMRRRR